jgi:hypothetical protein
MGFRFTRAKESGVWWKTCVDIGLVLGVLGERLNTKEGCVYYLRSHQERAKVDRRRSALDRGHSCLVERLEVILPVVEGGDEEVGGSGMGGDAPRR